MSYAAIAAVVVVIATMAIASSLRRTAPSERSGPAAPAVVVRIATIPSSAFETAGIPSPIALVSLPAGTPQLSGAGRPELLYVGAEYCPYCAAERWVVVTALSRFGTFSGLGATTSSTSDIFPGTRTFSFYGASFASQYIAFDSVETETNRPAPDGGYTALQSLTSEQRQVLMTYDGPPYFEGSAGAIPFVDIAGAFVARGASFDPASLKGLTMQEIADGVADPTSQLGRAVRAAANAYTAAICEATGDQPSSVCASPVIRRAIAALPAA
jgi:hypothetical protein